MIILLDTSTPTCHLTLVQDDGSKLEYEWLAERQLANGLHAFIYEKLQQSGFDWQDIKAIGVFKGPGSYTGLRIGLTVANTLAEALNIPIVGESSDDWQAAALRRLDSQENDRIVLPDYGSEANITTPRK